MTVKLMPVAQVVPPAPQLVVEAPAPKPRKRRRAAVYDADGNEVLISLMCLKCHKLRPLSLFGLRKMADGAIRNQPWCRDCRGISQKNKAAEAAGSAPEVSPPAPQVASPQAASIEGAAVATLSGSPIAAVPSLQVGPAEAPRLEPQPMDAVASPPAAASTLSTS